MVAPIFRFRNVKLRLTSTNPTFVYGVVSFDPANADKTLADGIIPSEVSSVLLTVQIANLTANGVTVSAYIQNAALADTFLTSARTLVEDYPLVAQNAFDPLSGNLVMGEGDQLWIQTSSANSCDVIVSLLEIANATAS